MKKFVSFEELQAIRAREAEKRKIGSAFMDTARAVKEKTREAEELTPEKIKALLENQYTSQKWNEAFLKALYPEMLEKRVINDLTFVYHAKRIATIITSANFKRSDNKFDFMLYLSVCGYDYFNGSQSFYNIGGEEIISECLNGLIYASKHGANTLDEIVESLDENQSGISAFKLACKYANAFIHKQKSYFDSLALKDIELIGAINKRLSENEKCNDYYEILTSIIEHIKLTPIMIKYLDYATSGISKREIARLEHKDASTVRESFKAIQNKFIKYCKENEISPEILDFINAYLDI